MSEVKITAGPLEFLARLEREKSPKTCEAFERVLALPPEDHPRKVERGVVLEIPLGDYDLGVGLEEATSVPAPGEILFYPGGYSETEILFP